MKKKMIFRSVLILIMILFALSFAVFSQEESEEEPDPNNPDTWDEDYVQNNPEAAFGENPDRAVELYPGILGNENIAAEYFSGDNVAERITSYPDYAKDYFADSANVLSNIDGYMELMNQFPEEAGKNPDVFAAAAAADNSLLSNRQAVQNYFSSSDLDIPIIIDGDIAAYNGATFTTAGGQSFTTVGLSVLAGRGYTFEVNPDGRLIIIGPPAEPGAESPIYSFAGNIPGEINDDGDIISGSLDMDGDGDVDINIATGPVTPTAGGLYVGPGARITADVNRDGFSDSELSSDNGFIFSLNGECASGNCVDVTNGALTVRNQGDPPSAIDINYDAYDTDNDGVIEPGEGVFNAIYAYLDDSGTAITISEAATFQDGTQIITTLTLDTDSTDCP